MVFMGELPEFPSPLRGGVRVVRLGEAFERWVL
jgi:hypothetical protein